MVIWYCAKMEKAHRHSSFHYILLSGRGANTAPLLVSSYLKRPAGNVYI
jgi:hypothetical protein